MKTSYIAALVLTLLSSAAHAKDVSEKKSKPQLQSPLALSDQLKNSVKKVRPSCVAVFIGGYGSGVIISADGLVITAAHMLRNYQSTKPIKITLHDGRTATAKLLGYNRETDFALLQLAASTDGDSEPWPHCELADTAVTTGGFCFTIAHPSGILKGRPGQVRIGRITSHSLREGKPYYLTSDCNIQPGDSGGPLFSIEGKLIAVDSSAASNYGYNIFPAIDQFHLDRKRLVKGEKWGDLKQAPDGKVHYKVGKTKDITEKMQQELMRRYKLDYPPTVDFMQTLSGKDGKLELTLNQMINHMTCASIAITKNNTFGFGLDDPDLVALLPKLPKNAASGFGIYFKDKRIGYGTPFTKNHLIVKASILPEGDKVRLKINKKWISLKLVAEDSKWDLALLEVLDSHTLPVIDWEKPTTSIVAGDLLLARDHRRRMLWNVATDQSRIVKKKRSIGPVKDKTTISRHRAPYPLAIRHALPLYAADNGKPVFNQQGELIGIHIARLSRTMGLIIPKAQLAKVAAKMLTEVRSRVEIN